MKQFVKNSWNMITYKDTRSNVVLSILSTLVCVLAVVANVLSSVRTEGHPASVVFTVTITAALTFLVTKMWEASYELYEIHLEIDELRSKCE